MGKPTEVRVRVPASSANLGPGFDTIEVSVAPRGVTVEVEGEGAGRVPRDDAHLVVRAMRTVWAVTGDAPPGFRMRCRNAIPQSRGLGSSAAAAVGGAMAAIVLAGRDAELERDTVLQVTAGMEGHADNAAASLLGGFVVAWVTPEIAGGNIGARFHAVRLDAHPDIHPVAFVAGAESLTSTTRGLLPERVPLVDAAFTGSRTALSVLAFSQRPELLMPATEDRLHQGYRRPAYPESADLVDTLRGQGVPAAISGAGPTVLAFTADGRVPAVEPRGFTPLPLSIDAAGVVVES
jgi:homoserine kinase